MNENPNSAGRVAVAIKSGDTLSDSELSTLRNALVVAGERYAEHQQEFQGWADKAKADPAWAEANSQGMVHSSAFQPLADQFALQVQQVRNLIDWLDGPEDDVNGREVEDLTITRRITLA